MFILLMVCCLSAIPGQAQFSGLFQINGTIKGIDHVDKVLIRYRTAEGQQVDTTQLADGKYSFTGRIEEPHLVRVWILHPPNEYGRIRTVKKEEAAELYINPGVIDAYSSGVFSNIELKGAGAKWHKDYEYLLKQQQLTKDSGNKFVADYKTADDRLRAHATAGPDYTAADRAKDSAVVAYIDTEYVLLQKRLGENILLPYIKANPGSPISLWALKIYTGPDIKDYREAKTMYESLSDDVRKMPLAKPFTDLLAVVSRTAAGEDVTAPVFSLPDTLGKPVSLESFRGKYVLVDFWASWCGPCRALNPHVLKLYNKYQDKGFTVLSVSTDTKPTMGAWKKAIVEDGMIWPQVVDADGNISRIYHITSVPQNFLVNPEGKIIAKNLTREELESKLAALLIHLK